MRSTSTLLLELPRFASISLGEQVGKKWESPDLDDGHRHEILEDSDIFSLVNLLEFDWDWLISGGEIEN